MKFWRVSIPGFRRPVANPNPSADDIEWQVWQDLGERIVQQGSRRLRVRVRAISSRPVDVFKGEVWVATLPESTYDLDAPALVKLAPGSRWLELLPWIFRRETIEGVFMPALLDMRTEYFDALAANRSGLARAIYVRWWLGILETIVLQWGVSLAKKILAFWKIVG